MKTKIRILVIAFVILSININTKAQSMIEGKIANTDSAPIYGATISLLNFSDSAIIRNTISDTLGLFRFKTPQVGKYFVKVDYIGYNQVYSQPFEIFKKADIINLGLIKLALSNTYLNGVIIKSRERFIEQKEGKLVFNLKNNLTSAGSSVLEVIEKLPGVNVNRQNNTISIAGRDGAIVMFDGKRNYMPISGLLQMLAGMNTSNIEKIELITNPSSSLDAEGNAGFMNIVLKKAKTEGLSANIEIQSGYEKGSVYGLNGDINYVKGPISIYGGYSFSRVKQDQISFNDRENDFSAVKFAISTMSLRYPVQRNHNFRIGADYQVSKSTNLGVLFTFYNNRWSMNALNTTKISSGQSSDSVLKIDNQEINQWQHYGANFNLQHTFKNQKTLSTSLDYLHYTDNNPTDYKTDIFSPQNTFLNTSFTKSSKFTPIDIVTGKLDYIAFSTKKINLQIGVKSTFSHFNNDVSISSLNNGAWTIDSLLTSKSTLREILLAAYGELHYEIDDKTKLNVGLRFENTSFDLGFDGKSGSLKKDYGNWFPNISLSHKFDQQNSIFLSYSKRINRPAFNDIAPFSLFIDPYTFFSGNPAIQPSLANIFGLNYNWNNTIFSLSYSDEKEALAKFQISVDPSTNIEIIRPENLQSIRSFNIGATMPIKVTNWWNIQASVNSLWREVKTGVFHDYMVLNQWGVQFTGNQSFKLSKSIQADISGFYNSKTLSGTSITQLVGGLNFGIQKKFNKSAIRFNINDILNSSVKYTSLVNTATYHIKNGFDFSQRIFKISYSFNFGKNNTQIKPKYGSGAEEEKRRVE